MKRTGPGLACAIALGVSWSTWGCSGATPEGAPDSAVDGASVLTDAGAVARSDVGFGCDFDADGDGEIDDRCVGGSDCNDGDALIGTSQPERCGDGRDNDCDGTPDETDCATVGGSCDSPVEITSSGTFLVQTSTATSGTGCSSPFWSSVTIASARLRLAVASVVHVSIGPRVNGSSVTVASSCGESGELCGFGGGGLESATPLVAALPAGDHWLTFATDEPAALNVSVSIEDSMPPENDVCAGAAVLAAGSAVDARFVEATDDLPATSCAPDGATRELAYRFVLTETRDVLISARDRGPAPCLSGDCPSDRAFGVSIRTDCGAPETQVACEALTDGQSLRARSLPAGSYSVIVEGPRDGRVDLTLELGTPTTTPPGETCDTAIPLTPGLEVTGSLAGLPRGVFYELEITSESDVDVMAQSLARAGLGVEIRAACDDPGTALSGDTEFLGFSFEDGVRVRSRAQRIRPGRVWVVALGPPVEFSLRADVRAPVPTVTVSGNESCAGAHVIPAAGGRFATSATEEDHRWTGRCRPVGTQPEAAFRLELTRPSLVTAAAYVEEGGRLRIGDAYVEILSGSCAEGDLGLCGANYATRSELAAGTWYLLWRWAPGGLPGTRTSVLDVEVEGL
ncbi:MAG: putative metal-binding motif-containing protein [Deltaproteobacteria bacterium]|jgi:hypothetical protein